jgi:hypothetical protein
MCLQIEPQDGAARRVGDQEPCAVAGQADAVHAFLAGNRLEGVYRSDPAARIDAHDAIAPLLGHQQITVLERHDPFRDGDAAGHRGDSTVLKAPDDPASEIAPDQPAVSINGDVVGLTANRGDNLQGGGCAYPMGHEEEQRDCRKEGKEAGAADEG